MLDVVSISLCSCKHPFEKEADPTHLDAPEERIIVHLVHGAVVDLGNEAVPPVLLVVRDEVFGAGHDADALDAGDGLEGGLAVEVGVGPEAGRNSQ